MKKFALMMALAFALTLAFAGFAMAAPADTLGQYDAGGLQSTQNPAATTWGWTPQPGHDTAAQYVYAQGTWDGYTMLDPRFKDMENWTYGPNLPVVNANRSGEKVLGWTDFRRSLPGQNVHTNFQANTNSCASCHMTHTAAGAQLLFRAGVYATCSACHDGSGVPFLNVFKPSTALATTGATTLNIATNRVSGTFGVDPAKNASVHMVAGSLSIAAAPGGNRLGTRHDGSPESGLHVSRQGDWGATFTCASCHAPHGSYSYRLMHYNPNRIANRDAANGGTRLDNLQIITINDPVHGDVFTFSTDGTVAGRVRGPWLYGYDGTFAERTTIGNYLTIVRPQPDWATFNWNGITAAQVLATGNSPATAGWKFNFKEGYFKATEDLTGARAQIAPALVVSPPVTNVNKDNPAVIAANQAWMRPLINTSNIDPVTGFDEGYTVQTGQIVVYPNGRNYNFYCAACHTDYERALTTRVAFGQGDTYDNNGNIIVVGTGVNAASQTGIYSKAHRHTTWRGATSYRTMEVVGVNDGAGANGNMMCISCHFVHGTDSSIMKTADEKVIGNELAVLEASGDVNTSSAIKRYTNMASCWKCHTNSHAKMLKNNDGYWNLSQQLGFFGSIEW